MNTPYIILLSDSNNDNNLQNYLQNSLHVYLTKPEMMI